LRPLLILLAVWRQLLRLRGSLAGVGAAAAARGVVALLRHVWRPLAKESWLISELREDLKAILLLFFFFLLHGCCCMPRSPWLLVLLLVPPGLLTRGLVCSPCCLAQQVSGRVQRLLRRKAVLQAAQQRGLQHGAPRGGQHGLGHRRRRQQVCCGRLAGQLVLLLLLLLLLSIWLLTAVPAARTRRPLQQ
jgi:hypothetical protein